MAGCLDWQELRAMRLHRCLPGISGWFSMCCGCFEVYRMADFFCQSVCFVQQSGGAHVGFEEDQAAAKAAQIRQKLARQQAAKEARLQELAGNSPGARKPLRTAEPARNL